MKKNTESYELMHLFRGRWIIALTFLSALLFSMNAYAVTNNLPDCSQSTVQSAISSSSSGDILVCPVGSWSWSDVNITKNITLQGAGIGVTNISITSHGGIGSPSSYTGAFRITGFTFTSTANFSGSVYTDGLMEIDLNQGFRVDHNRFQIYSNKHSYSGGNGIVTDRAAGLIDHNYFGNSPGLTESEGCPHAMIYPMGNNNSDWLNLGSQIATGNNTIFIEDNEFYQPLPCNGHNNHAVYGQFGGFHVFRHNIVTGMNMDAHGFCAIYGTREYQWSNNTITNTNNTYSTFHARGGTGVIFGNSITGTTITHPYFLEDYRFPGGDGGCSASQTSNVPGYGNVSGASSCPEYSTVGFCAEQIGRGQNNSYDPMYIWGNTGQTSIYTPDSAIINTGGSTPAYILSSKPGFTEYPYPHPLQGGEQTPPPSVLIPAPPTITGVQ